MCPHPDIVSDCRVDPCAVCEEQTSTPITIASSREYNREMVALLGEFTGIPDSVKLEQLSKLMYSTNKEAKEDFQKSLSLLPVELVRAKIQYF